jgi:predicted AlkP superfamily phosphohydrolase/phosphomutase/tetratricopeptide (TPR) repeat protein
MSTPPRKVLLIGWDAADWNVARPLIEQGKMPVLKRLMDSGVWGDLATIRPVLSPMLWTSIATGKRAWKHGIHGFSEPCPASGGIRPITNLSRKTKAIWNILNQQGWRSNVVGWWPSSPAEPINGVMVSNHFQQAIKNLDDDWPMRPGTVHPDRIVESMKEMRVHPAELENEHILPFIPKAAEIDQEKDKRMESCAKIIAEISGIHAAATATMQLEPWDFMGVYYDGIDHFGHAFMKYHPPRQPWVDEKDFELYKDVIEAGYRYHDMMLDTLLKLAGDDTTVMLISDHGFEPGNLRPQHIPHEPAGPAAEHSQYGVFCLRGPGIKQGERIHGATLLDITPTLLHLYGLPVGRDMDGKVLVNCFGDDQVPEFTDSWDDIPGEHSDGRHPQGTQIDAKDARESLQQLVDLGYIDAPNPDRAKAIDETVRELDYNLAQAYLDGGRFGEAALILERLWENWPQESRFGVRLLSCALALCETEWARATFDLIIDRKKEYAPKAAKEIDTIMADLKEKAAKENKAFKPEDIDCTTQQKIQRLRSHAGTNVRALAFLQANVLKLENKPAESLAILEKAAGAEKALQPSLLAKRGELLRQLQRWDEAAEIYAKLIEIDPRNPEGHYGLAVCELARKNPFEAAARAREALELNFHHAQARYVYAKALMRLGKPKFAEQVLQAAVAEMPRFALAHAMLGLIYRKWLKDPNKSAAHMKRARESAVFNRETRRGLAAFTATPEVPEFPEFEPIVGRLADDANPLIVVSGLPRSGTSLMMQMLAAGGVTLVTDNNREADESNHKGYFEDDRVKKLLFTKDRSWLKDESGKAIKIVAPLLRAIPSDVPLKIIFMERDASEVIASQRKMLEREKKAGARTDDAALAHSFAAQLRAAQAYCEKHENIELLPISYKAAVSNPAATAAAVSKFLGYALDATAMVAATDPSLYRSGNIASK